MTKEQCSLQPNYYGSSCDFQDLQSAVQQLTTKSDAQFEELKNEKWFHRIFNMVVCPRKNNIRMAEQITSLAQAQGILIEILVRLADQDANIAGMVMQSQSDIRALAQNSAYLQERLYLLEDKSYGIKENENLKDLNSQQRNILSGCLNEASKLYAMPSNEQRLYANELLNYLNADAQVANLEDALDDLEDNAKRKILSCIKFVSGEFKNNRTYGACASFLSLVIRNDLTFSNNRFVFPDKPTYEFICKDWAGYNAFIRLDGNNITVENSVFECENNLAGSSYMIKTDTYAINGPRFCLSDTSREKGTISNCTFVRVSNCIREMGVVQNCVFENCSNVVNNCGYMVRENLFNGCKQACVDLQKKAIVSNCQFANCTGFNLITSTTNSEVKIEDCEFSNISTGKINSIEDLNNFGAQEYFNGNAPHDLQMLGIKGSVIEFGAADKKFANANHPNKIVRCIFNNIHICPTQSYYYNHGSWKVLGTENQSNFMISVKIFEYEKFDYPRAVVSDCSFTNCFAASDSLINEYFDFKPVFSKNRYYRLIRQENNYGLNNMRNPSDFVESNNVKLKETNASGKKIGSSMPVEWDDSEYTTCKMATTWLNTFNKA